MTRCFQRFFSRLRPTRLKFLSNEVYEYFSHIFPSFQKYNRMIFFFSTVNSVRNTQKITNLSGLETTNDIQRNNGIIRVEIYMA